MNKVNSMNPTCFEELYPQKNGNRISAEFIESVESWQCVPINNRATLIFTRNNGKGK